MAGEVGLWDVAIGAFMTVATGAFGLVWKRQDRQDDEAAKRDDDIWVAINDQRTKLSDHKEVIAREYITKADLARLEAKIDRLLEARA